MRALPVLLATLLALVALAPLVAGAGEPTVDERLARLRTEQAGLQARAEEGEGGRGGLAGVVVSRKNKVSVLLLDGMREISGSADAFERTEKPAPQPHLTVHFKDEASEGSRNFGAMTVIDTTIHKGPVFIKFEDEPPAGYTKCGWVSRAAAVAYAKYLGARYEET